jgi:predicted ester cyclase
MADRKAIARQVLEEPWKGNWDVLDRHLSPEYIGHDPAQPETIRGIDAFKANFQQYVDGFEGARISVIEQIGEGDLVASRWTANGRHTGEIAGIAPTGKDTTVTGITFSKFDGDRVIEEWTNWDTFGMLVQLGAIPMPATA